MRVLHTRKKIIAARQKAIDSAEDFDIAIPDVISNWMARLKLLYGLPFSYLVPHEDMSPVESIRFFQLDQNWLECLEDGAFSIGSSTTGETAGNIAAKNALQKQVMKKLQTVRKKDVLAEAPVQQITGFIMRSALISNWPQLEIEGYADEAATVKLEVLRMSLLSSTVMIGLFNGALQTLVVNEPAEGVHFGVNMPAQPDHPQQSYTHYLRYLSKGRNHAVGQEMPETPKNEVTLPVRTNNKNVLNITASAGIIQTALQNKKYTGPFTAAEFALEMVEGVQMGVFNFKTNQ